MVGVKIGNSLRLEGVCFTVTIINTELGLERFGMPMDKKTYGNCLFQTGNKWSIQPHRQLYFFFFLSRDPLVVVHPGEAVLPCTGL